MKSKRLLIQRQRVVEKLPPIEAVLRGSILERAVRCGQPSCRCASDGGCGEEGETMGIDPSGAQRLLSALLASLTILQPTLTRPGFANFQVIFAGWIQTTGLHAVTEALVVTDVARRRHHERFHRFFS